MQKTALAFSYLFALAVASALCGIAWRDIVHPMRETFAEKVSYSGYYTEHVGRHTILLRGAEDRIGALSSEGEP